MRQPEGVALVIAVLQPFVLLNRRRIGQMNPVSPFLQTVDQSVPVEGRLDGDPLKLLPKGCYRLEYLPQVVG